MDNAPGDLREPPSYHEGRYGNHFHVGYNRFEFVLAFGQSYVGGENETVHTSIVTTPPYAKAFAELLRGALAEYEKKYGTIPNHGSKTAEGVSDHADE